MDILTDLNRAEGITVLVSLHQVEYALSYCPHTIAFAKDVWSTTAVQGTHADLLAELYGAEARSCSCRACLASAPDLRRRYPRPRT